MAQIIFLLLVVGLAWFGYRKFVADAERLSRLRRRSEEEQRTGATGTLIKDPETGEYRVRRDEE
jgi:membrane protein implicated in regulation of membrane protease activity